MPLWANSFHRPSTAMASMRSDAANAACRLVWSGTSSSSRWLGRLMTASACVRSARSAAAAVSRRWPPSNSNGSAAQTMTRAPWSRARRATSGAAPLPVPPPRVATTNTRSAAPSRVRKRAVSSSAASLPTATSPPAPKPRVRLRPRQTRSGSPVASSACSSVSTPATTGPSTHSAASCAAE